MTATYNAALVESNSTVTYFRAWGKWISDAFAAAGLVQTSDTGQIDWSSVALVNTASTVIGYEIWRFDDSLQSTLPVFIKIEYGTGVVNCPGLWLTVGTGTDGSGNLTGSVSTRVASIGDANNTTGLPSVISGSSNRICGYLWDSGCLLVFAIERTHDSSGNDTADGIMKWVQVGPSVSRYFQYLDASSAKTRYDFWNVAAPPSGTGVNGNTVSLYPIRGWNPGETPASQQLFAYFAADITVRSRPTVTLWDGSSVTIFAGTANGTASYGGTTCRAVRAD